MHKTAAALVALALSFSLAACGDDSAKDSTGSDEPKALTKAELIEQGDAICKASNDRIKKASAPLEKGEPTNEEAMAFITESLIPEVEAQTRDLRALAPPADDAAEIDAMLDSLEAEIAKAKADPAYVMSADGGFVEANQLARDYGFKVCGED